MDTNHSEDEEADMERGCPQPQYAARAKGVGKFVALSSCRAAAAGDSRAPSAFVFIGVHSWLWLFQM